MDDKHLEHALYYLTRDDGGIVIVSAEEAQALQQLIVDMHAAHAETEAHKNAVIDVLRTWVVDSGVYATT